MSDSDNPHGIKRIGFATARIPRLFLAKAGIEFIRGRLKRKNITALHRKTLERRMRDLGLVAPDEGAEE